MQAAHALGDEDGDIIRRHIVPNVMGPVLTAATLDKAFVVVGTRDVRGGDA